MRAIIAAIIALGGMALSSGRADAGAWCATLRWGSVNCSYSSSDQCWATVRGIGGFWRPNPFPGTAYGSSSGTWNGANVPRRSRRAY